MELALHRYRMSTPNMPRYNLGETFPAEICCIFWIFGIYLGARFAPFPTNFFCALWLAGIPACIPIAAWIGTLQDKETRVCREMMYFLRGGMVVMRAIGWPITLLASYLGESKRRGYISQLCHDLRTISHTIKPETAMALATSNASRIDQRCDAVEAAANQALDATGEVSALACRTGVFAATLTGVAGSAVYAQDPAPSPTTSVVLARTGENLQEPFTGTYHLFEFFQVRGNWIYPDIGTVDFATNNYRECFIGGGRTFYNSKHVSLTGELYFVEASGSAAKGARYLWPNLIVDLRLTPKLTSQTSYFPYVPLDHSAHVQEVIERSKLEYAITRSMKMGGGYGAYQYANGPWQSKPMFTTTVSTRAGSLEFWLQKIPAGAQVQMRYSFAHISRH